MLFCGVIGVCICVICMELVSILFVLVDSYLGCIFNIDVIFIVF